MIETSECNECPVCIQELSEHNTVRLNCSHVLCTICEQQMLKTPLCVALSDFDISTIKCPICRNVEKPSYDKALLAYKRQKIQQSIIIKELTVLNTEYLRRIDTCNRENRELKHYLSLNLHTRNRIVPVQLDNGEPNVEREQVLEEGEIVEERVYSGSTLPDFDTLQCCRGVKHISNQTGLRRTKKHCMWCQKAACNECKECYTCLQDRIERRFTRNRYHRFLMFQTFA